MSELARVDGALGELTLVGNSSNETEEEKGEQSSFVFLGCYLQLSAVRLVEKFGTLQSWEYCQSQTEKENQLKEYTLITIGSS